MAQPGLLLQQLLKLMLLLPLSLLVGFAATANLLLRALTSGPRHVFGVTSRGQPPSCLQDPRHGAHSYIYLKDIRLHYVIAGSEGKPLMVLLHGFPDFWYSWRHQLAHFKDTYRLVAIDQRGYGDSDRPTSVSSYDVTRLVNDVRGVVSGLGYERCVLVGHDAGGDVAWRVAAGHRDLVHRLVILGCPSPLAAHAYHRTVRSQLSIRKSARWLLYQLPWLPELCLQSQDFAYLHSVRDAITSGNMTPTDLQAYKFMFGRSGFTGPLNYFRQAARSKPIFRPAETDLAQVSCPTLVVWGLKDATFDPALAKLSCDVSVVAGGATVRTLEGAGHWVHVDSPDIVNACIREFLSKKAASTF